jgi:hypothetical protein
MSENDALDLVQERTARVGIGALPEAPARAAHPNTYPDAYPGNSVLLNGWL